MILFLLRGAPTPPCGGTPRSTRLPHLCFTRCRTICSLAGLFERTFYFVVWASAKAAKLNHSSAIAPPFFTDSLEVGFSPAFPHRIIISTGRTLSFHLLGFERTVWMPPELFGFIVLSIGRDAAALYGWIVRFLHHSSPLLMIL